MNLFYSWQSDLPNKHNRSFIQNCIDKVVNKYRGIVSINADRDTKNETGSPDISTTIFDKINDCDLFIADISIINKSRCKWFRGKSKPTPNPNVLIELGYSASTLGWDRIVCIYNTDYSDLNSLPFDLRQHRITSYSLKGKNKTNERDKIINAISSTIDGLLKNGHGTRPKNSNSLHMICGFDCADSIISTDVILTKVDFSLLRKDLVKTCHDLVEKLNLYKIDFIGDDKIDLSQPHINLDSGSIIHIEDSEKTEVVNAVKKYLNLDLRKTAFCFGNLKERRNYLSGGYDHVGTDEEKEKYENYLLLKRVLTEITILDMFSRPFENTYFIPLAIKNISKFLDKNINVVLTVSGDDFKIIEPGMTLIDDELKGNCGFICEYDFVRDQFSMEQSHEIKYDEDLEVYDFYSENSRINLWDAGTSCTVEDCINVICDYIAKPTSKNIFEFKITSLQANETKWLDKVILIKTNSGKIEVEYSIRSDNTDGSIVGKISQ